MANSEIWTEKYRPEKFEEVVGQDEIVKRVRSLAQGLNIPHLLLAGPAGTGKSTLALIVVKDPRHSLREKRYLALGQTRGKRLLFIAFTLRKQKIRVVSARPMSRKEREIYEKEVKS